MASTYVDFSLLQSVHNKLRLVADLNDQLARCPRMVRAAEAAEKKLQSEWEDARHRLQDTRKHADEKQLQLRQREARIERMTGQKNASTDAKEFQLLGDQIQADLAANNVLSDEILELLEKADRLIEEVALAKSNHEKGIAEAARVRSEAAGKEARIREDLGRVTAELAELEKRLPGDLIGEYRRLVKAVGAEALSETDGETCGGCHSVITAQTLSNLYAKKAVFCTNCRSLLYPNARMTSSRPS